MKLDTPPNHVLLDKVVSGGYCIGCGTCAAVMNSPYRMKLDNEGFIRPRIEPERLSETSSALVVTQAVCPFLDNPDEDEIGRQLFSDTCQSHPKFGYYSGTYAGYVAEGDFRKKGSSGGMGTWIATELLRKGLVDAVIHVKERKATAEDRRLFQFDISNTPEDLALGAKSKYYPVELSEVLHKVRSHPGRYAVIGLPCFIKSIRLLSAKDAVLKERLCFLIGLVCGHLKSAAFADYIGWLSGIAPGELRKIDFRYKDASKPASEYSVYSEGVPPTSRILSVKEIFGYDWGKNIFKYEACDYCDDVYAETADVVIGDAWLKQYVHDSEGTNIIITRHPVIEKLLIEAKTSNRIQLDTLSPDDIVRSQAGGLRHRRDGLAYRLYLKAIKKQWYPPKRVQPDKKAGDRQYRKIFALRQVLRAESFRYYQQALRANQLDVFIKGMKRLFNQYDRLYDRGSFIFKLRAKIVRWLFFLKGGNKP